jgi:hypothetical protein
VKVEVKDEELDSDPFRDISEFRSSSPEYLEKGEAEGSQLQADPKPESKVIDKAAEGLKEDIIEEVKTTRSGRQSKPTEKNRA